MFAIATQDQYDAYRESLRQWLRESARPDCRTLFDGTPVVLVSDEREADVLAASGRLNGLDVWRFSSPERAEERTAAQ